MSAQVAFVGRFVDMDVDFASRWIVLQIGLPFEEMDAVFKTLGIPPGHACKRPCPPVALMPAYASGGRLPVPWAASAALTMLNLAAMNGEIDVTPELRSSVRCLARLCGVRVVEEPGEA